MHIYSIQVGFNRGNLGGFFETQLSKKEELVDIEDQDVGSGKGRFIYKISGHNLLFGGCLQTGINPESK